MATTRVHRGSVARIVEGPGWLELRRDDGVVLCTMIHGRGSREQKQRARAYLIIEARSLGYAPIEPARGDGSVVTWTDEAPRDLARAQGARSTGTPG